jgi:dTDP-N-acetylfucosamine:lipid II N-acetylfucosaminyltransferase
MIDKRYIHFATDEKFINSAIEQFKNIAKGQSIFYILVGKKKEELKHVLINSIVVKITKDELNDLKEKISINSVVFFHSIYPSVYSFILGLNKKIKIVWFCFGYEIFNDVYFFDDRKSLEKLTFQKFGRTSITKKEYFGHYLRRRVKILNSKSFFSSYNLKRDVFKRFDFIGLPFIETYNLIKKVTRIKAIYFEFNYYPIEIILKDIVFNDQKKYILVGNSGYPTSNHLEAFDVIKNSQNNSEILVPLSYGNDKYIEFISEIGLKYFNNNLRLLNTFMSLENYNEIISKVDIAFLINKRPQAVGNTIALIYLGANVILHGDNPMYLFLKRIGVVVHEFNENLDLNQLKKLSNLEMNLNREKLLNYFSKQTLEDLLRDQLLRIG